MIAGKLETAKSVLQEYVNGTVGFVALGEALEKSPKSLMRMLSVQGNPQVKNVFEIVLIFRGWMGWCWRLGRRWLSWPEFPFRNAA